MDKIKPYIDELICYSTIKGLRNWLSGYFRLFDNLPGDLFTIEDGSDMLSLTVLPSNELIQLHKEARRRYEKLD